MSERKTICIDFDGVIHSYVQPWKGVDIIPDPPNRGAFDFLERALEVFDVVVCSTRATSPEGFAAIEAWFVKHGLPEKVRARVSVTATKPPAIIYIDDRAWLFRGAWPTLEYLQGFQPWKP